MRIGIDATWARNVGSGTASYTRGLVTALTRHVDHEFVLYFQPRDESRNPLFELGGRHVECRTVGTRNQVERTALSLSRACIQDQLDVYHSPGYFLPLWTGPKVVAFHDVNMFTEWDKWWRQGARKSWLSLCLQTLLSARIASRIVCTSATSVDAVHRVLHVPRKKVSVLYPGIDDKYFDSVPPADRARISAQYNLDEYLLFVGVLSPIKNLENILRAFAAVRPSHMKLAIAGREYGTYFRDVLAPLIESLRLTDRVEMLGVVPENEMPALYAGATAFLFPSYAEGFGLPPLEAMACGTAVIASTMPSLPEVLGDAALLAPPDDLRTLEELLDRVIADRALRHELSRRGKLRAAGFRWNDSAERALQIYAAIA